MILFSDLHIDLYGSHATLGVKGLESTFAILDKVFQMADDHNTDIAFGGDLYNALVSINKDVVIQSLAKMNSLFKKHKAKFYFINGNHDHIGINRYKQPVTSMTEAIENKNFICIDNKVVDIDGIAVAGIPYYKHGSCFELALGDLASKHKLSECIGLIHQCIADTCIFQGEISEDILPFKHTFCGHIHKPQENEKFTYIGSPMHHTTGDIGQNKYIYLYDGYKLEAYETGMPKFLYGEPDGFNLCMPVPVIINTDVVNAEVLAIGDAIAALVSERGLSNNYLTFAQQCI